MKQIGQIMYLVYGDYNLLLNDDNIKKMSVSQWKYFVKSSIFKRGSPSVSGRTLQIERPTTLHINIPL